MAEVGVAAADSRKKKVRTDDNVGDDDMEEADEAEASDGQEEDPLQGVFTPINGIDQADPMVMMFTQMQAAMKAAT